LTFFKFQFDDLPNDPAVEINKMVNLRFLQSSINPEIELILLSTLCLPNLRRLNLYGVVNHYTLSEREEISIFFNVFQHHQRPCKIKSSALSALVRNCKQLQRISKKLPFAEVDLVRRIRNVPYENDKFCQVCRPAGLEKFKKLDYDSMEGYSDEEDI
jgi:hypothetical protein